MRFWWDEWRAREAPEWVITDLVQTLRIHLDNAWHEIRSDRIIPSESTIGLCRRKSFSVRSLSIFIDGQGVMYSVNS